MTTGLKKIAHDVAACLRLQNRRVAFAESCTGGLIAAALAQIPGISDYLCGSAVAYRLDTKTRWLGVPADILIDPGPVSEIVAKLMATGVLAKTPEADCSAAITGHLGPHAPDGQDGLAYIAVSRRESAGATGQSVTVRQYWLGDAVPEGMAPDDPLRERRQVHAAELVLRALLEELSASRVSPTRSPA